MSETLPNVGGRPPAVPPLTQPEQDAIQAEIKGLLDENGKVDPAKFKRFQNELRLEWAVTLKHLVRRSHGRDASALIKLGADLVLSKAEGKPPVGQKDTE